MGFEYGLKIEGIIWIREIVEKLASKHHVEPEEVEEVLNSNPIIRFIEKGKERAKMCMRHLGEPTREDIYQCCSSGS